MRIVVTDVGTIWNAENPYLEQYKDDVLLVCLSGMQTSTEYKCIVTPYRRVGLGAAGGVGIESVKYRALESIEPDLIEELEGEDDIIFLTDNNPETLYPVYALAEKIKASHIHLCAFSPFRFEPKKHTAAYQFMLDDLSCYKSICWLSSEDILKRKQPGGMDALLKMVRNEFGEMMQSIIDGIHELDHTSQYYFDIQSKKYRPLTKDYYEFYKNTIYGIHFTNPKEKTVAGLMRTPEVPSRGTYIKEYVEMQAPRTEGKQICSVLRKQRIELAKANNIPYESKECNSSGVCSGTCSGCDDEVKYLSEQLLQIPELERVYPKFEASLEENE